MLMLTGEKQVLFFESRSTISGMQEKFKIYADKFPVWATQSDAMTQYAIVCSPPHQHLCTTYVEFSLFFSTFLESQKRRKAQQDSRIVQKPFTGLC